MVHEAATVDRLRLDVELHARGDGVEIVEGGDCYAELVVWERIVSDERAERRGWRARQAEVLRALWIIRRVAG
jgi:hypothetical protein